jgi:predicted NUDIX family NTP pyrophosphohydrolase
VAREAPPPSRTVGIVVAKAKPLSVGFVLYRLLPVADGAGRPPVEVLIGHLGGPFWATKDEGAWSFPKGLLEADEEPFDGALREFREEVGFGVPGPPSLDEVFDLGVVVGSAKSVHLFATSADVDLSGFSPGMFEMEWPPRSGRTALFPEIDRIAWSSLDAAEARLSAGQRPFIARLRSCLV